MKNKKGKKLVVLGAMAALLTLIGVSGSQTYAKYVESTNVTTQSATVAKWGFVQWVSADNLFGSAYGEATDGLAKPTVTVSKTSHDASPVTTSSSLVGVSAQAFADANIVQPGGSGSLTFNVAGKAEVPAKFEFSASQINDIVLKDTSDKEYHPVEWRYTATNSSTGTPVVFDQCDWSSFEKFAGDLNLAETTVTPNTEVKIEITVEWRWVFDHNTYDGAGNVLKSKATELADVFHSDTLDTNEADTLLGILSKGSGSLEYQYTDVAYHYSACTELDVTLSMTATQVQKA